MKAHLCLGAVWIALSLAPGLAVAQVGADNPVDSHKGIVDPKDGSLAPPSQLRLTAAQKSAIAEAVRKESKAVTKPPSFVVSVGAPVPPAIELYILPDGALAEVPVAKSVKYTVVHDQVVLVDPTTMRVVDVITK